MKIDSEIINDTINSMSSEFDFDFGWRFSDQQFSIGDELPNSFEWEGDEQTDIELDGTSVFDEIEDLYKYAKYSKGQIMIVMGVRIGSGQEPGESIMSEATVLQTWIWDNGLHKT